MEMKTKNLRAGRGRQRRALLACTTLVALPAAALAQDGTVTLQPITVETASDETSIVAGEVTGASGMPTDILDTPASVSVVTAAEIEQRGAESVEEVLQYTPGVLTDNWGADERFDAFRIRGFNAFTYRDGLRLGSSDRGGPREEVFAFERVEVSRTRPATISGSSSSVTYIAPYMIVPCPGYVHTYG